MLDKSENLLYNHSIKIQKNSLEEFQNEKDHFHRSCGGACGRMSFDGGLRKKGHDYRADERIFRSV